MADILLTLTGWETIPEGFEFMFNLFTLHLSILVIFAFTRFFFSMGSWLAKNK